MTPAPTHRLAFHDAVMASLDEAPLSLSTVALAVIRLTSDPEVNLARVSRAVSADTGLTTRIIRKANSAFYAGAGSAKTLPLAILKLGLSATRSLTIANSVHSMFRVGDAKGQEFALWQHSLSVGIGAHSIAHVAGIRIEDEAYIAGLLHDIGKLILLQRFPAVYEEHVLEPAENDTERLEREMTGMGFSHPELGARILTGWQFDPDTIAAVQRHHDMPADAEDAAPMSSRAVNLTHAIRLANTIVKQIEHSPDDIAAANIIESPSFRYFALTTAQLDRIITVIRERVGDELQVFGEKHGSLMQKAMTKHPSNFSR